MKPGESKRPPVILLETARDPREAATVFGASALVHVLIIGALIYTSSRVLQPALEQQSFPVPLLLEETLPALQYAVGAAKPPSARPAPSHKIARSRRTTATLLAPPAPPTPSPQLLGDIPTIAPPKPSSIVPDWSKVTPAPPPVAAVKPPPAPAGTLAPTSTSTTAAAAGSNGASSEAVAGTGTGTGRTIEELEAGDPVFTPFDLAPELINRDEIRQLLWMKAGRYQRRGIDGLVVLWILIDTRGKAHKAVIHTSSGRDAFDEAALSSVRNMRFQSARSKGEKVPVWVQLPVRFVAE